MSYRPDLHAPEALGAGEYDDAHAHTESTGYHVLKTWPELFGAIVDGWKTFEWRKADRNFEEGDHVLLREWDPATEKHQARAWRRGRLRPPGARVRRAGWLRCILAHRRR